MCGEPDVSLPLPGCSQNSMASLVLDYVHTSFFPPHPHSTRPSSVINWPLTTQQDSFRLVISNIIWLSKSSVYSQTQIRISHPHCGLAPLEKLRKAILAPISVESAAPPCCGRASFPPHTFWKNNSSAKVWVLAHLWVQPSGKYRLKRGCGHAFGFSPVKKFG